MLFKQRSERARRGTHPVDQELSLEMVTDQLDVFLQCALHLSRNGMYVYIREGTSSLPVCIVNADTTE